MKAIIYEEYGGPEVLRIADVDKPTPASNQVLIRVHAAEATKADCEMRRFKFAANWFWLPLRIALGLRKPRNPILGNYFAGVVETSGDRYDVIFSMVAQTSYSSCIGALRPGGRYIMANPKFGDMLRSPQRSTGSTRWRKWHKRTSALKQNKDSGRSSFL
jgi:NADPH:quinone reductase-like Zn-dependent oxidoreductase